MFCNGLLSVFAWFAIWIFPEIGVPPNHPNSNGIFPCKASILGYPFSTFQGDDKPRTALNALTRRARGMLAPMDSESLTVPLACGRWDRGCWGCWGWGSIHCFKAENRINILYPTVKEHTVWDIWSPPFVAITSYKEHQKDTNDKLIMAWVLIVSHISGPDLRMGHRQMQLGWRKLMKSGCVWKVVAMTSPVK